MIHVFYVPGMFGSTIEYCLRRFGMGENNLQSSPLPDGSMHDFDRHAALTTLEEVQQWVTQDHASDLIVTTPIYPFRDHDLKDIIAVLHQRLGSQDRCVLMYAPDQDAAELNLLFQYHKIAMGHRLHHGMVIFGASIEDLRAWKADCQTWQDLSRWQLREWLSLDYRSLFPAWIQQHQQAPKSWLRISNRDFLQAPQQTLDIIATYCGMQLDRSVEDFIQVWRSRQEYVVKEFALINDIMYNINDKDFCWAPISLAGEAILQQRLRDLGIELACDGLDIFPTSSRDLNNFFIKGVS